MSTSRSCSDCGNSFHLSQPQCPHCGRPGLYGNVYAAEDADEVNALEERYQLAKHDAATRGSDTAIGNFETALLNSQAVIARPVNEVQRLATSDNELYATYYQLLNSPIRLPTGEKWDVLRASADSSLFPNYKEEIRFGALSLDGLGVSNYGECFIVLKTDMIAHRASVFEENSVRWIQEIKFKDAHDLPKGYRATWDHRGKLSVAKLASKIDATTPSGQYSEILMRQGASTEEDDFVEVHIWGSMTIRTIERVTFNPRSKKAARIITGRANQEKLAKFGVAIG
jgi:hypothetical protein